MEGLLPSSAAHADWSPSKSHAWILRRSGATGVDADASQARAWRWLAAVLALLVHAPIALLLGSSGEAGPAIAVEEGERIRLVWSRREPMPAARVEAPSPTAVASPSPRAIAAAPASVATHDPPVAAMTDADDAWSLPADAGKAHAPVAGGGPRFQRDLFAAAAPAPFGRADDRPRLGTMRDTSLGGRLQEEARRRACGSLRATLASRPESTAAVMASMRRWNCPL